MPLIIGFFLLFTLANLSFPLSLGFIAEIFIFISTLNISPILTILICLVAIKLPIYFFTCYQKISYGKVSNYLPIIYQDLNIKEFHILLPLIFFTLLLGIYPQIILNTI